MSTTDGLSSSSRTCLAVLLLYALGGCVSSSAPDGWIPEAAQTRTQAFGSWIELEESGQDAEPRFVFGELIAVDNGSVLVLGTSDIEALNREEASAPPPVLHTVPVADIESAQLFRYDSNWPGMALWSTVGFLSTASHGVGLIISAPLWLLFGTFATSNQSRAPLLEYPDEHGWKEFIAFARFPQGLPDNLDRSRIQPKRTASTSPASR